MITERYEIYIISEVVIIKISVIMPAYNVENYIEQSVESVMSQTFDNIELIIINDASTDRTWEKIISLMKKYGEKIIGVNLEKNLRQGGARNRGIREANGEYITFVDSDDFIKPDMLEKFYNAITQNNADMAGATRYYEYYSDNKMREICANRLTLEISGKIADKEIREKYFFAVSGLWRNIYRKDLIVKNGIWFPEGVSFEDNYFFSLYLSYVKKYVAIDESFYYYRQNPGQTVRRKDCTHLIKSEIEKITLRELQKRGIYDEIKDGYEILCVRRWYINTVGLWFSRLGRDSVKLAQQMAEEFNSLFPNYRKNKYYRVALTMKERFKLNMFERAPYFLFLLYSLKNKLKKGVN